ncbi:MAG: hypothetical protein WCK26_00440 [Candidatus Saccharibacteria bacterium]
MSDKTLIMLIIFVVPMISLFASFGLLNNEVQAAYSCTGYDSGDSREPNNYSECDARKECGSGDSNRHGAIWFTNKSGYYEDDVVVNGGATSVSVSIRGSYFQCNNTGYAGSGMKAEDINKSSNSDYDSRLVLDDISVVLNRGDANSKWDWSSQGSSAGATLDVTGLGYGTSGCAPDTTCETIYIQLYRCPATNNPGGCGSSPVRITIVRPIPYNYFLIPSVNLTPSGVFEAGSPIVVTPSVLNNFPDNQAINTRSTSTQWTLSRIILPVSGGLTLPDPLAAYRGESSLATTPCDFFKSTYVYTKSPSTTCSNPTSPPPATQSPYIFIVGPNTLSNYNDYDTDLNVGDKICYTLSVQPSSNVNNISNTNWVHSKPVCNVVGKRPKVQILGGDLSVGKKFSDAGENTIQLANVQTSTSLKPSLGNKTFGSWVEYGIFATGTIRGTASASAFAGGLPSAQPADIPRLSFANDGIVGTCSSPGCYAMANSIPDVAASFPTDNKTVGATISDFSGMQGTYKNTETSITISGGTIAKNKWIVINAPTANVTIEGNINYTSDSLNSINEIPQLVIIAKNIIINDNVTNVDAWLIAKGTPGEAGAGEIKTCTSVATTASTCNQPLFINGPVMAKKLYLWRTGGSGSDDHSGDPAEIINLKADAYLWAKSQTSSQGRIRTVFTTELPPRL